VTLNPALRDVSFCPRCAAPATVRAPRSLSCASCGYQAYYNPSPVAAAIPRDPEGRIILLRRGGPHDPGLGLWTFPGGFVDLGETVEQAAIREAQEELRIDITLEGLHGVYSRPDERIVLVVYIARTRDEPQVTAEATEVRAFAEDELPWDELAFWSTELALRELVGR
jgi:mutator protein MutT